MSDYIDYDEFGITIVRCMACKKQVAGRTYIELPSRREIGKVEKVLVTKRFANWRQIKVDLSDNTYAEPIVCSECENKDIDLNTIELEMKKGWKKELQFAGKSAKELADHDKKVKDLKVRRKI